MTKDLSKMQTVTEVKIDTETVLLCKKHSKCWLILDKEATVLHTGKTKREAVAYIDRLKSAAKSLAERKPDDLTTVKDEPAPAKPKAERIEKNGVKRPKAGGLCAAVWDYLDSHPGITAKELRDVAPQQGFNVANASCEFYQWRKFNGISGRQKATA